MAKMKAPKASATGSYDIDVDLGELTTKQKLFCRSKTLYTAYGGARGGGKTHAVRWKAVMGALRYAGIKILIIRRTYPELQSNHIEPIQHMVRQEIAAYNGTLHQMTFANGSTIKFGHYAGKVSENEYQGQQYHWIFIDEATQFTEREFRFLGGLLRSVDRIPKRMYLTCNPGGVGHQWVKRLFIERKFKTTSLRADENENPKDYSFVSARVEDNTYLMEFSPAYIQMLSSLPENLRKAHRDGDWDALAGNYFPELDDAVHITDLSPIPNHWLRYRAFDYGLDMLACGWFVQDDKGRSHMYRELLMPNLTVSEAAKMIKNSTLPHERIVVTFAPPDMWNRQKDSGKSMAELFVINGIPIVQADNNRVQGWLQLKELLAIQPDGRPMLTFSPDCTTTVENIKGIQTSDKNPNDCAKDPHEITHAPDMVRYYCISRTLKTDATAELAEARRQRLHPDDDGDDRETETYHKHMTGYRVNRGYIDY